MFWVIFANESCLCHVSRVFWRGFAHFRVFFGEVLLIFANEKTGIHAREAPTAGPAAQGSHLVHHFVQI